MATGQDVKRLQVVDEGVVVAQAQIVIKKLPLGNFYALAAKGPAVAYRVSRIAYPSIIQELTEHLKQKHCIFFRTEPSLSIRDTRYAIREVKDINPPATLVLDVTPTEEELLKNMHEKTRYNIRLSEKKGLRVTIEKNFDIFWDLLKKTGERDDFVLHSKKSYETIMSSEMVQQIIVWSEKTPVATAGLVGFNGTMYYLYGASDHTYRQLMGPHLMQWEAIKLAKKLGYKYYDFFGIAPSTMRHSEESRPVGMTWESHESAGAENSGIATVAALPRNDVYNYDPTHRYAGVTRFKLGFGGMVHEEPGTYDLVLSWWGYGVYRVVRNIRRLI